MNFFFIADIIGIAAFTLSGLLTGVRYQLDLLGIAIVSTLTALGGGILRDALIGEIPFAFSDYYPSLTVLTVLILVIVLRLYRREELERKFLFIISDTLGLVAFSITGALVGIAEGLNIFGTIILGFLTAVGGGIIRDVLLNRVPAILTQDVYGTIALLVSLSLALLHLAGALNSYTTLAVGIITLVLRLIAYKKAWQLPKL
ncbi:MAG: TRIC cation channel family protein [Campylobacterales bacterium]